MNPMELLRNPQLRQMLNQFRSNVSGNPEQLARQAMQNSGMNQQQLNIIQNLAKQIQGIMTGKGF